MRITRGIVTFVLVLLYPGSGLSQRIAEKYVTYTATPSAITFYWKDAQGKNFGSLQHVKSYVENRGRELLFAMNGGMYKMDSAPQGLYVEQGKVLSPLDTLSGNGNFYLMPNGVFYITSENTAVVCKTTDYNGKKVKFATQSGPMLLIDGEIHPAFRQGSQSLNIRNGVGILPDGQVIFVISTQEVNFYDFAMFFKSLHCRNALYLDGFVSRAYAPSENWKQLDGSFGVIIGVTK